MTPGRTRVEYCENSTIVEAWAVILGLPGPVDPGDPVVLERAAKRQYESLRRVPAIVAVDAHGEAVSPFWNHQVAWNEGRRLARFGHRYLSVHFIRQGEGRYTQFGEVLEPPIREWVDIYSGATEGDHPVDRIGFGYVNRFTFGADDFDLSTYFAINVGVDVGAEDAGLLGLSAAFRFFDEANTMYLNVELSAEAVPGDQRVIGVTTKVFAERRGVEQLAFGNGDQLLDQVRLTKEAAKDAFFSLATEETHAMMGVVHASDGS